MASLIDTHKRDYAIVRQINGRTFLANSGGDRLVILRIITKGKTRYASRGIAVDNEFDRIVRFVCLFATMGFGPKYVEHYMVSDNQLVVVTEHVKYSLLEKANSLNYDEIDAAIGMQIDLMHAAGIIHGDLLEFNIRLDDSNRVYFIGVDTAFLVGEADAFALEWMSRVHGQDNVDSFMAYEKQLYKSALQDDELDGRMVAHLQDKNEDAADADDQLPDDAALLDAEWLD